MSDIIKSVEKSVGYKGLINDFITAVFYIVVILYLTQMTPQLPPMIKDLFKNNIFRVVILFMILLLAKISRGMALIVSIAFVVTMNTLQIEYFEEEKKEEQKEEKVEIAEPVIEVPKMEENEQTGCFDERTFDMSKVSASLENEGELYGSI